MGRFNKHRGRVAQPAERFRMAPNFQFRRDAGFLAQFTHGAVAIGDHAQIGHCHVGGPAGRAGNPLAAERGDGLHFALELLKGFRPPRVVIDNPFREGDHAFNAQPQIGNSFFQIAELAAILHELIDFVDPRFDRLKTRPQRQSPILSPTAVFAREWCSCSGSIRTARRRCDRSAAAVRWDRMVFASVFDC